MEPCHRLTVPGDLQEARTSTSIHRQRRAHILTAALGLAAEGYDAVRIRSVAERAGVATSTVYNYFSSRDDLLVSCLNHWLLEYSLVSRLDPGTSTDPYQRLLHAVERVTGRLCAMPQLAEAVARAYLCADSDAAANAALVRNRLIYMFADAMGARPHSRHHREVSELVTDMWAVNLVAFVQNRVTPDDLMRRLNRSVTAISQQETTCSTDRTAPVSPVTQSS